MPDQFFDPSIALGVKIPPPPPPGSAFDLLNSVGTAQKALVDAQSATAVLNAHKLAGQLIAAAPDLPSGLKAIEANPQTAGFAQDIASSLAGTQQTLTTTAGLQQGQTQSGLEFLMKVLGANVTNPAGVPDAIAAGMKALPPDIAAQSAPAMGSIVKSLTDGLPADPQAASDEFSKRLAAVSTAVGGVSPDTIRAATGNLPPSLSLQPLGSENTNIMLQQGGPMAGPQAAPHEAGAPPPVTSAPLSPAELSAQISKAANTGPLQQEMADNASAVPFAAKRLNTMLGTLSQFQSGGGADARASVGKIMQGLKNMGVSGISQEDIDKVSNSSLSATQLFESEVKPLVISELKASAQGTGRVMRSEVDAFLASMDDTTDPSTLLTLLNQAKYRLQLGYDQSEKYLQFKQLKAKNDPAVLGVDEADFPIWYSMHYGTNLPDKTGGGIDIGPSTGTEVKGTPQAKPSLDDIFGPGG